MCFDREQRQLVTGYSSGAVVLRLVSGARVIRTLESHPPGSEVVGVHMFVSSSSKGDDGGGGGGVGGNAGGGSLFFSASRDGTIRIHQIDDIHRPSLITDRHLTHSKEAARVDTMLKLKLQRMADEAANDNYVRRGSALGMGLLGAGNQRGANAGGRGGGTRKYSVASGGNRKYSIDQRKYSIASSVSSVGSNGGGGIRRPSVGGQMMRRDSRLSQTTTADEELRRGSFLEVARRGAP